MTSKKKILSSIQQHLVPAIELPELNQEWIRYENPREQFLKSLAQVGGEGVVVANLAAVNEALEKVPEFNSAQKISSFTQEITFRNEQQVDLDQVEDPHDLADLDFAIIKGEFGVAENGAIWVTDAQVKQKAAFFIAQHVVVLLPANEIVHHMHEAYPRSGLGSKEFQKSPHFGVFLSGPSKTADIEQSLVIGAHGARSLRVYLVEDFPA